MVDIPSFWSVLDQAKSIIDDIGSGLTNAYQQITNVGHGIFSGLSALASAIWHAILEFAERFKTAFSWIATGLHYIENGIYKFGEWIYNTFSDIGSAIYSGLQWLYNGFVDLANLIINALESVWNWLVNTIHNLIDTINDWISDFVNGINNWFSSRLIAMRQKLKESIIANITLYFTWKGMEKAIEKHSLMSVLKVPFLMFASYFSGRIIADMVDKLIPTPSQGAFELIPSFNIPRPSLGAINVPRESVSEPPSSPSKPAIGYGLPLDVEIAISREYYAEVTTYSMQSSIDSILSASTESVNVGPSITTSIDHFGSTDTNISIASSVEIQVA